VLGPRHKSRKGGIDGLLLRVRDLKGRASGNEGRERREKGDGRKN